MTAGPLLRIEGLSVHSATGVALVDGISLELARGEVLGLIGESGAGKSTIGLAALGFARGDCRITAGRILLDGLDLRLQSAEGLRRLRGRRVAYVAQSAAAAFNPALRLIDQICEGPVRHGLMSRHEAEARAIDNFRALGLPDPTRFGRRYAHQVSGGQLQRAMAIMAMSCGPDLLVLDEPTTALDVTTQIDVLAHLKTLIAGAGTAALYISHDLAVVAQIADRLLVLRHGKLVETGPTEEILARPQTAYARALVAERTGVALAQPAQKAAWSVRRQAPRPAMPVPANEAVAAGEAVPASILDVQGLAVRYGRQDALSDASFALAPGETLAVIGESGSGKTSLAYAVSGLVPAHAGRVSLGGIPLAPGYARRSREQLRRLQLVFQLPDVALNPRQRIASLVGRPAQFYRGMRGEALAQRVAELLGLVGLDPALAARWPGELSGGQKQRVCIARALAAEPDVLVCDEVTAALDPLIAEEILQLQRRLQEQLGLAYLFITHDLATVRRIAHRVLVLWRGRVVAQGPTAQVLGESEHSYVKQLCASEPQMRRGWLEETLAGRVDPTAAEPVQYPHAN